MSAATEQLTFGAYLAQLRKQVNFSQNDLALRVGCDNSYISRLERGNRSPEGRTFVLALARALGVEQAERDMLLLLADHRPENLGETVQHASLGPLYRHWLAHGLPRWAEEVLRGVCTGVLGARPENADVTDGTDDDD